MAIPPRFMSELRDRLTLSEIVGRRVKLTRAGREFKGCCPFHQEKTPSFYVNDDKQFYHCFGCGAHGDAVGFLMQNQNLSFIEAVEALAAQAGMQVPQQTPEDIEVAKKQKDLHALLEETTQWFEKQLYGPGGRVALDYMRGRGVSDELLAAFRIGYAPGDGQALWKYLKDKGFTDQQMIDAAVVKPSTRGTSPFSFFRERVMFPVADKRGRVVAFGGRILPEHLRSPDKSDFKPPKYINSSDSPLFHKGRMLYGESHARQAAADDKPLIVVEGYLDVMSCFSIGYSGAVAPLGTALTEEQIAILWQMMPGPERLPVLCFDGDEAGRRAAVRACDRVLPLLKPDQSVSIVFLPEGQDPDSLIRAQGREAFDKVLAGAVPLIDFIWSNHTGGRAFKTPESRAGLEKALEEVALKIADRPVQQYYQRAFRDRLYQMFAKAPAKAGKGGNKKRGAHEAPAPVTVRRPTVAAENLPQQILLAAMINHPGLFDRVEEDLGHLAVGNERLDLLRQTILNTLGGQALDSQGLQTHLEQEGYASELKAVLSETIYTHAGFARPGADIEKAMEGWRETIDFMHKNAVRRELREAGKALAQDCSKDNEDRVMTLYRMHNVNKASEG